MKQLILTTFFYIYTEAIFSIQDKASIRVLVSFHYLNTSVSMYSFTPFKYIFLPQTISCSGSLQIDVYLLHCFTATCNLIHISINNKAFLIGKVV